MMKPEMPEKEGKKNIANENPAQLKNPSDAESQLLREQLIEMAKQVESLKEELSKKGAPSGSSEYGIENKAKENISVDELTSEEAQELLMQNPVGFVSMIVEERGSKHLGDLKEQAELEGALRQFKRAHPQASQFQNFIMEEVAELIKNDPDGVIDPWGVLLEKALKVFEEKFRDTIKNNPELLKGNKNAMANEEQTPATKQSTAFVEGAVSRKLPEEPANFTREQIGKMSLKEFLKNEDAINEALRSGRIK